MANPEVPAIFEGIFENDGVLVRVDVLQRRRDDRWRLIEVKSTTSLKEEHLDDVESNPASSPGGGWTWLGADLALVNRDYVFDGGSIDPCASFSRSGTSLAESRGCSPNSLSSCVRSSPS